MDDANRTSLITLDGRETLDVPVYEKRELETRLRQAENQVKQLSNILNLIEANDKDGDSAARKLKELATQHIKVCEQVDDLLKKQEDITTANRNNLQRKDDEIESLKHDLCEVGAQRDEYLKKCQELEQRISEDESRFYQQELEGRPTTASRNDRIRTRLNKEMQDSQINLLFNQMDQTDADMASFINQSNVAVENLDRHTKNLTSYHDNLIALYDQLKHTAGFLSDIVHSLGLGGENSQIDLLVQKINELTLDLQKTDEVSRTLASESQQVITELTAMSTALEQSVRGFVDTSFSRAPRQNTTNLEKISEFEEEKGQLLAQIEELNRKLQDFQSQCEGFKQQVDVLTNEKRGLVQKYDTTLKLAKERDDELKNREDIIKELEIQLTKPRLPDDIEKIVESQLEHIYTTLTTVNTKLQAKVHP